MRTERCLRFYFEWIVHAIIFSDILSGVVTNLLHSWKRILASCQLLLMTFLPNMIHISDPPTFETGLWICTKRYVFSVFRDSRKIYICESHFMDKKIKRYDDFLIHDFLLIFCENKQIDLCSKGLRNAYISFKSFCFSWQREKERISDHK